jgi:hypothetical protein
MKLIYVAGPYSASSEAQRLRNILNAWDVARYIWALPGLAAICPHCNSQHMGGEDIDYEKFLAGDFEILRRCDAVVLLPHWRASAGAKREAAWATQNKIPVVDMEDRLLNPRRHPATLGQELQELFPGELSHSVTEPVPDLLEIAA